jgi:uncharacterized protein (TIGR00369 family)
MSASNQILDPNYKNKVMESFARQSFMQTLGASITNLGPGFCEILFPYQESLTQQHKFIHAGAVASIADSAAGYAAFTLSAPNSSVLTTEYKINLLSPAKGDRFIARSKVIKSGKTLKIAFSEVYAVENNSEKLCAVLLATVMILENKSDS